MNLIKITEKYLKESGFDGLYNDEECACKIGDLMPCDNPSPDCSPGYEAPCDCGDHDWHIGEKRGKKENKPDPNDKIDHGFKSQALHTKWPNMYRDGLD